MFISLRLMLGFKSSVVLSDDKRKAKRLLIETNRERKRQEAASLQRQQQQQQQAMANAGLMPVPGPHLPLATTSSAPNPAFWNPNFAHGAPPPSVGYAPPPASTMYQPSGSLPPNMQSSANFTCPGQVSWATTDATTAAVALTPQTASLPMSATKVSNGPMPINNQIDITQTVMVTSTHPSAIPTSSLQNRATVGMEEPSMLETVDLTTEPTKTVTAMTKFYNSEVPLKPAPVNGQRIIDSLRLGKEAAEDEIVVFENMNEILTKAFKRMQFELINMTEKIKCPEVRCNIESQFFFKMSSKL